MSAMRRNYVAGTWVPSASDEAVDVINPATEEVIDQVPAGHPADVDAAVEAARAAFGGWAATPVAERARCLEAIRQLLEDRASRWPR
jgi:aldehyde dehydrogenase (NAD+)